LTSVDAGVRINDSSHKFVDISGRIGGFSQLKDSPNGSLFSDLLVTARPITVMQMAEAYSSVTFFY